MINLDREADKPLYLQLFEQIRAEIITGSFPAGSKLPPIRKLAEELGIARNTVETSYQHLAQEGYVVSRAGSGYRVEHLDLEDIALAGYVMEWTNSIPKAANSPSPVIHPADLSLLGQSERQNQKSAFEANAVPVVYDFTYRNLEKGTFPSRLWRTLIGEVLLSSDVDGANRYPDNAGEPQLRNLIARKLQSTRGLHCDPRQVILQSGTQASLMNLLLLFDSGGKSVAVEEPGYDGVRTVFANAHFTLHPCPIYRNEEEFLTAVQASRAKLAFITPSNQFPTGRIMGLSCRQRLLDWAHKTDAYLIEDDYCREYRYNTRPLPSLQFLDRYDRVIYMGTLSKVLSPALRMNYLVLPPQLLGRWNDLFSTIYPSVSWLSQAVLTRFLEDGHWEKHLRRTRAHNKRKHELLLSALKRFMGSRIDIMESGAGLHVLVGVHNGSDQHGLIAAAAEQGVRVYDTDRYWMTEKHPLNNYVLVGFSAIEEDRIEEGVKRLARAWFG
ncbi:MAG: PLP-dependent aminotransferase family protein [Raoultibacter sp.]